MGIKVDAFITQLRQIPETDSRVGEARTLAAEFTQASQGQNDVAFKALVAKFRRDFPEFNMAGALSRSFAVRIHGPAALAQRLSAAQGRLEAFLCDVAAPLCHNLDQRGSLVPALEPHVGDVTHEFNSENARPS